MARCKLCGKVQRTRRKTHNWSVAQHCAVCHYMGKSYVKTCKHELSPKR